jgi:SAM-dependent methyltransferase
MSVDHLKDITTAQSRTTTPPEHWSNAARVWEQVGAPLRPQPQDTGFFQGALEAWAATSQKAPRALILGVTPELYNLNWPDGTDLIAIDHTRSMIDCVWPGDPEAALNADWRDMPLEAQSRDIAMCDGGFHLLSYPLGQQQLVQSLSRVLAPGGIFVVRLFVPPATEEAPDAVLNDLLQGEISSLNIFKLRLGMSLQKDPQQGTELKTVWETLHQTAPDLGKLAAKIGWTREHIEAINTYKDSPNKYCFVPVDTVCDLFCSKPGGFGLQSMHVPTYELAERCPSLVFRRIRGGA